MKDKIILVTILLLALFLRQGVSWNLLFSLASVVAIWYFVGQLFPSQRLLKVCSAFFLAISPWHIKLVTQSIETNLAILFAITGTLILVRIIKKRKWLFIFAAVFIFIINQLTFGLNLNLANSPDVVWLIDQQRREHGEGYNGIVAIAFHNKAVNYSLSFLEHWGEHFSGDFLFIQDNPALMYLVDILFLAVGFFNILKKGQWNKWGIIFLWLALAPANSAFDFAPPDYKKAVLMVIPLVIISSWGVIVLFESIQTFLKSYTIKK